MSGGRVGIPVVDLALPLDEVAKEVGAACATWGFFYVTGHGLTAAKSEAAFDAARRFFELPDATKERVAMFPVAAAAAPACSAGAGEAVMDCGTSAMTRIPRGYFASGQEKLDSSAAAGDRKEGFDFGPNATGITAPNRWPAESAAPGFKAALEDYADGLLTGAAPRLMRALALSLGLDDDFFVSRAADAPIATMRLLRYPPLPKDAADRDAEVPAADPETTARAPLVLCGAHTDYGYFTLLAQGDLPGLQVFSGSCWIDVPPRPDCMVVNVGDMFSRWTGGRYRSTLHRVVHVPGHGGAAATGYRHSIPFFMNPRSEVCVEPLCSLVRDSRTVAPAEVARGAGHSNTGRETCGSILLKRYRASFESTPSESSAATTRTSAGNKR